MHTLFTVNAGAVIQNSYKTQIIRTLTTLIAKGYSKMEKAYVL